MLAILSVRPTLLERIGENQRWDMKLAKIFNRLELAAGSDDLKPYEVDREGWLRKEGRLCVPNVDGLREEVLREGRHSKLTIHLGGNKMYRDLKQTFYWEGMKRDVGEFISKCINFQLVKAEKKKPSGLLHPLEVPQWKWEHISMDFIDGLPRMRQGYDNICVIVDLLTKSAHFILVKSSRMAT